MKVEVNMVGLQTVLHAALLRESADGVVTQQERHQTLAARAQAGQRTYYTGKHINPLYL